jgi:hypothetical protein
MSETTTLKRDFANVTDATSMLLVALGFRSRRLRDFICGLQGVAGARHEFDCTHLALARRLDHNGRVEAAELFVTRYLAALEKEQKRVGRYLFKIERGSGIEHRPTRYVDYISRAAVWATQQARQSALWKESHTKAIAEFIPAAIEMLPLIEEEESEEMSADGYRTTPGVQLARNESHALSRARANLNIIKENGGDVVIYAENLIARFTEKILERARLVQQGTKGEGISFDTLDESETVENMEESQSMLTAALAYARAGIPVFPVKPDKSPYTANGFKDASTDEATTRQRWHKWPDAGIGVPTGEASGWLVSDIDPRHGGDASLSVLIEQYEEWPATLEARTGGGGHHIIFAYPQGSNIRNSAGKLGEGIDVRGDGGYIIVAPSVHASGKAYEWLNEHSPAQAPEWLLKLLTEEKQAVRAISFEKASAQVKGGAATGDLISEGERNNALFRIGCALRGQGYNHAEIEAELIQINSLRCVTPLPVDEVQKIAGSAARYSPNAAAVGV